MTLSDLGRKIQSNDRKRVFGKKCGQRRSSHDTKRRKLWENDLRRSKIFKGGGEEWTRGITKGRKI